MCGRYSLSRPERALLERFDLFDVPPLSPRYNIAPTQIAPIVRRMQEGPQNELAMMRFGLVPSWSPAGSFINARVETVLEKPAFRDAIRKRRGLVVADGFFEWQHEGKRRVPHWFKLRDEGLLAFAGVYEHDTFAILTTAPNALVSRYHDRMPIIVKPEQYSLWLDPTADVRHALDAVSASYPAEQMTERAVSERLNNVANDDAACVLPDEGPKQGSLF
jgi:putative SOS response-associated peptidase YedK